MVFVVGWSLFDLIILLFFLGWLILWGCRKEFLRVCLGQNWLLGPRISLNSGV